MMGDRPAPDREMASPYVVILQNIELKSKGVSDAADLQPGNLHETKIEENKNTLLTDEAVAPTVNSPLNADKNTFESPNVVEDFEKPIKEQNLQPENDGKVFTDHIGPEWHKVSNKIVTKPIISDNLPLAFKDFPIFGKPENIADLKSFQDKALQEFVGLTDDEFEKEKEYCSPDFLLSGQEMEMRSSRPTQGLISTEIAFPEEDCGVLDVPENPKLHIQRKLKSRIQFDFDHIFQRKLKYRGVRILPALNQQEKNSESDLQPPDLDPGKDVLFRIRFYRPFSSSTPGARQRHEIRGRHSVFNCDVLMLGRQCLTELRDRIVCRNEQDMRMDMSENPGLVPPTTAKDSFPSSFMFINNVFYVDMSPECRDISATIRAFAEERGIGTFPVRDMRSVTVSQLRMRLAYPEVYVHQGSCEHVFQFSEIRLLNRTDSLHLSNYPCHTAVSQNQTLYCNTCAEFSARWIVTETHRVPFDPAYFCDICFHSYMYKDGKKIENFKAFQYKGNGINILRPNMGLESINDDELSQVPQQHVRIFF